MLTTSLAVRSAAWERMRLASSSLFRSAASSSHIVIVIPFPLSGSARERSPLNQGAPSPQEGPVPLRIWCSSRHHRLTDRPGPEASSRAPTSLPPPLSSCPRPYSCEWKTETPPGAHTSAAPGAACVHTGEPVLPLEICERFRHGHRTYRGRPGDRGGPATVRSETVAGIPSGPVSTPQWVATLVAGRLRGRGLRGLRLVLGSTPSPLVCA